MNKTDLIIEQKAQKLQKLLSAINELEKDIQVTFAMMGKIWKQIQEEKLWKYAGSEPHSFREFIVKEVGRSHTTVYNMIWVYETFGCLIERASERGEEIPPMTRLVRALPYIKNKEDAEEWYHKAKALNSRDYQDELRRAKGKIPMSECEHEEVEPWVRCKICGKFLKEV